MGNTIIKVENLGKLYRLGEIGTGTISHDLNRWWARVRGKQDPFAKIGEKNDRTSKGNSDYVWALKDVDFEVKQGEVLGIIGRNGAGKSTLLKILSKVTTPSEGRIKVKGRIASLLEVGTGFHPELTGRENIYLNGAILGMTKTEIARKFDEIVAFAGVERYIDTPVKRYSSGMYVRLAFSVAAFLEPEILIVDEVLAVGDAEFQKKCLGRMKDVSTNDGRTVLFVSHDLFAVEHLCSKGIYMKNGTIAETGTSSYVINQYIKDSKNIQQHLNIRLVPGVTLTEFTLNQGEVVCGQDVEFSFKITFEGAPPSIEDLSILMFNSKGIRIALLDLRDKFHKLKLEDNQITYKGVIKNVSLVEGEYSFGMFYKIVDDWKDIFDLSTLTVKPDLSIQTIKKYDAQHRGFIELEHLSM